MVYTALSDETLHAELVRQMAKTAVKHPARRRIAEIRVALTRVLDLRDPNVLHSLGIEPSELLGDDPALPRELGEAAHYLGFEAILAPSATAVGDILAVFGDNRAPTSTVTVLTIRDL